MRKLVGLFASAAILVAACGGTSTTPAPASQPAATPPPASAPASGEAPSASAAPAGEINLFGSAYAPAAPTAQGGSVIIGDWQEANEFNPFRSSQVTEANIGALTFHSLLTISDDFKYIPQLAAEPVPTTENGGVTVGEGGDAMTVTWKLRDGLKWSDGEPLTCDDFKYAWEWTMDPDNVGVILAGFEDITAIDCPTDVDMVLHFKNVFEGYLTMFNSPLPRHYLEKIPMKEQVAGAGFRPDEIANLPVSGPFKFASVTPLAETRLARNDNFVGAKSGTAANLDEIVFKWYGDPDAMIAGYRGGEVDLAFDLADSDIPKVQDLGAEMHAIPALLYEFLRPNWSPGPFTETGDHPNTGGCSRNPAVQDRGTGCPTADPAIRAAIAYAIDKNEINTRLLGGNAQVANTNISPSAWFYADQTPATFDPEKAKQILADGGWADSDGDGIVEKDGLKAKIELCTTTRQVRQDTLALISAWLKNVGIDSVINPVDATAIFANYTEATNDIPCALSRSNFDLAEHAFSSSIDPLGNYTSYHSSQFEPQGANDAQVSDPAADKALADVKSNVDFKVVRDAMAVFQKAYVDNTIEIPLYYRKNVELANPRVGNYFANGTQAGSTWNGEDWFATN
ncbi:MAG TPA: peptide ABC transporter substrate-binding protein [Candidatus Limnocylindrales bacterium]